MSPEATERRLAAIMFTDIVGYTALMARDEEAGRRARDQHEAVVRPLVERYHGAWIERTGDETLSSFPSALDAVNCSLAVQAELDGDADLRLRIGIHQGDVTFDASGVSGDGVNVAARVRPLAEAGGIAISDGVHTSVEGQPHLGFRSLGRRKLRNVRRRVEVYAVSGEAGAVPAVEGKTALQIPDAPVRSIAVLPLENLSGDPEQEYFADGMTEALIGDLAKISTLRVISRTSVMQYKRERKPLPEIAQDLDVDAVIEGTVMRAGERVRITVQLIDARADSHLWNDRYDRDLRDVLDLQSEVARAVAEQVRAELKPEEQASLAESHRIDPLAYDAFLRARQVTGTSARSRQWGPAVEYLERAVEIDPDFAEAWAQLALVQSVSGFNLRDRGDLPKVRACAQRALDLDDRLAAAHNARGWIMRRYDWDSAGARRCFERAMTLSPSDPGVLNSYIWSLFADEKVEEALAVSEQLLRVAPFEFFFRAQRVRHFYCARRYERALEEVARVREIFPDFEVPEASSSYFKLGRFEEAHRALIAWYEREAALEPFRKAAERGWAEDGWHGSIRATVELLAEVEGYSPASLALSHCLIDEWDEALACLERGYRERDPWMDLMRDPLFDPIRSDPRFDDLLRRIGFPES